MPGGTLGGSDQGEACTAFPLPKQLRKSAQLSQPRSYALRGPLWASLLLGARREARENRSSRPHGSLGHRRESRRGRQAGPSRTRRAGEERSATTPPTRTQEACWAPRWEPPPPDTRGSRHAWAPSVL